MTRAVDAWGSRPILIAHRIGNTPDQVPAAVAAGADLIEADVHLYRRQLEVRHTKTLGVLPWLWDRWYLVPARAPRLHLATLVDQLVDAAPLMLDLKGWQPWLGRVIANEMQRMAPGRPYVAAARAWSLLDAFESLEHVRIIHTAATVREAVRLPRRLVRHRTDAICVKRPLLDNARWHGRLRPLSDVLLTWPVVDTSSAHAALEREVDGLIVDGVPLIADLAAERRNWVESAADG